MNMSACQNKHHKNNNIATQNQIVPNLELISKELAGIILIWNYVW